MNFYITPAVKNLIILNLLVFVVQKLLPGITDIGALHYVFSEKFLAIQFITHMFMHASFGHIFSNLFSLFMFGPMLENYWGAKRFYIFYMVCGFGASLLYSAVQFYEIYPIEQAFHAYATDPTPRMFVNYLNEYALGSSSANYDFLTAFKENPNNEQYIQESIEYAHRILNRYADIPMVGASGAIFGILMAFGMLFPNTEIYLFLIPIPIKAKYFVTMYGLYEVVRIIQNNPGDNVAHFAHLGGMIFAYILIKIWEKDRSHFY